MGEVTMDKTTPKYGGEQGSPNRLRTDPDKADEYFDLNHQGNIGPSLMGEINDTITQNRNDWAYTRVATNSGDWMGITREQAAMARALDLGIKPMWEDFEAWLDRWVPHYPKCQYMALVSINDALRERVRLAEDSADRAYQKLNQRNEELGRMDDALTAKTLELETLKNKIVERAQVPATIKAKSAAEIRRMVEQENEREFEESVDG